METYQNIVMIVCLTALAVTAAALTALHVFAPLWDRLRQFASLPRIQQVVLGAIVIGFIHYGATKSTISFDGGIKQNPIQPSTVTNNLVSIHWTRDTTGGIYVPTAAPVYIDYRLCSDTNGQWQTLAETTVGAWSYSSMVPNATNYNYNVWAYYIPPEPVHTNGVWIYKTLEDRNEKFAIPLRARIEVNGKAIATPKEKRRDEND